MPPWTSTISKRSRIILTRVTITPSGNLGVIEVKHMVVSTYQAARGADAAMIELEQQTHEVLEGKPVTSEIFQRLYALNLFPTIQRFFQMDIMKRK
ncbi:hypothetical protein ABKV19_010466 [Rosa sericea]